MTSVTLVARVNLRLLPSALMMNTHEDIPAPLDATEVGDWTLDEDGEGRPFWGTVRHSGDTRVSITGWQYADGSVCARSILLLDLRGGALENSAGARLTALDILAATDELDALR